MAKYDTIRLESSQWVSFCGNPLPKISLWSNQRSQKHEGYSNEKEYDKTRTKVKPFEFELKN